MNLEVLQPKYGVQGEKLLGKVHSQGATSSMMMFWYIDFACEVKKFLVINRIILYIMNSVVN